MSAKGIPDLCSFVLLQVGSRRFALPAGSVMELAPPAWLLQSNDGKILLHLCGERQAGLPI